MATTEGEVNLAWALSLDGGDWKPQAACRDVSTDVFFPVAEPHRKGPKDKTKSMWDEPRAICGFCPVRAECLAFEMHKERHGGSRDGMFGGLTPRERAKLARERKGMLPRAKLPRDPIWRVCPCPRAERFDASLTATGKYASTPRTYATVACRNQMEAASIGAKSAGAPRPTAVGDGHWSHRQADTS